MPRLQYFASELMDAPLVVGDCGRGCQRFARKRPERVIDEAARQPAICRKNLIITSELSFHGRTWPAPVHMPCCHLPQLATAQSLKVWLSGPPDIPSSISAPYMSLAGARNVLPAGSNLRIDATHHHARLRQNLVSPGTLNFLTLRSRVTIYDDRCKCSDEQAR